MKKPKKLILPILTLEKIDFTPKSISIFEFYNLFLFSDLSVAAFNDLVSSGAGGILILIPSSENLLKISEEKKEIINALQDHLHTTEFEIPVYFSEESEQLLELLESLGGEAHTDKKSTSAASGKN